MSDYIDWSRFLELYYASPSLERLQMDARALGIVCRVRRALSLSLVYSSKPYLISSLIGGLVCALLGRRIGAPRAFNAQCSPRRQAT